MEMVPIKEAKNKLTALGRRAEAGERIVVTRNGKPAFDLVPHQGKKGGLNWEALRKWKAERGLPRVMAGPIPPDFDDPLPEDFLITPGN